MLRFDALKKAYGGKTVFADLRGDFASGTFAITGPNGSGKSTLLGLLSGAVRPDGGKIWIGGHDIDREPLAAKRRLAYVPDECPIYPFLTGRTYLEFIADVREVELNLAGFELMDCFAIRTELDTRFGAMSLGTQRKFMLSAAWIGEPPVLLIDEPTNALDAGSLEYLAAKLRGRRAGDLTLCTTHDPAFIASIGADVTPLGSMERAAPAAAISIRASR